MDVETRTEAVLVVHVVFFASVDACIVRYGSGRPEALGIHFVSLTGHITGRNRILIRQDPFGGSYSASC